MAMELVRVETFKAKIEVALYSLPEQQRTVMHKRYVEGKSWRQVSHETHYSEHHCQLIRNNGIKNLNGGTYEKHDK